MKIPLLYDGFFPFAVVRQFNVDLYILISLFMKLDVLQKSYGKWGMKGEIKQSPAFADAKGGENMNEPNRTEWEIRCAFNGFCKRALNISKK